MAIDNPFRESRLNESRDFRPNWDIPDLNRAITDHLAQEVRRLRGRAEPDPAQMIVAFTGPPGYGKTHLFGRVEHQIGHEVFFAFVPSFTEATPPLDHITRHVVEALFRPRDRGPAPLHAALARLCRPAFRDYFAALPPTLAARHDTLARRLEEDPEAVLEVVRSVKSLDPFLKLAGSVAAIIPHDAAVVRALALGWAPEPWGGLARRWLQGQDLPDTDREALGLRDESPEALDVLRAIPALMGHETPMMICCDQIEGVTMGDNQDRINAFSSAIIDLLQQVPAQVVLSCFQDTWKSLTAKAMAAFNMRVRQPPFKLDLMTSEQARRLIQNRLATWPGRPADRPPTWPFDPGAIDGYVRQNGPTPRGMIQACEAHLARWAEEGGEGPIELRSAGVRLPDLERDFLREWNRELEAIRVDPARTVLNLAEDRVYAGVLEALKIAQTAQMLREFGGVRISEVRDRIMNPTATMRRPGAVVKLAGRPGEEGTTLVVALTSIEASKLWGSYINALFKVGADHRGVILLHPRRDLDMVGVTRAKVDEATRAGRFRLMALEDHAATCHALECLTTLLNRAIEQRDLILGGVSLSADDCRSLVIKTGVIDHLDLFKMLAGWKRPAVPSAAHPAQASAAAPAPAAPAASAAPTPAPVPTPAPAKPAPAAAGGPDLAEWSRGKLAAAVKKLKLLGQPVEPDGFEVGPTFVRLKVVPVGKTSFRLVANKAVDLRMSLDLKVPPIVGSQAGCISIDVQRPERAVVTLEQALVDPPPSLAGRPAFPVGQDVAGRSHWLDLSEPADCHLLVAGTTGSGKSEFLRALIATLASRLGPDQLQFVLIDPKRVTFNLPGSSPYLRAPVAYALDDSIPLIRACMDEMDRRYKLLESRKLSNVAELPPELLPRIVVIVDEFASFLEDKESKKVVTALLKRIGSMARAAGIHLVLSTQRPDKDVVTPLLRDNLPGRIALQVASKASSDLILGEPDADNLLGRGDLFWKRGGELLRLQSPFVPQKDLEQILRCGA